MKITDIQVRIEPSVEEEKAKPELKPITLCRIGKVWHVITHDGTTRGLYPSEVALSHRIQTEVIHRYNSGAINADKS